MSFGQALTSVFVKVGVFSGRARRSEYWWFILAYALTSSVLYYADLLARTQGHGSFTRYVTIAFAVVVFVFSVAVLVRRLHDVNRSGGYFWLTLIPVIGQIVLIVYLAQEGTRGPNRYGPDPRA